MRRWLVRGWLVVGLALFVYVLTRQPLGSIARACSEMGPLAAISPLIAMSWLATRTVLLSNVLGGVVPWRALFVTRIVGDGFNSILPIAGIGGEPFKVQRLAPWLDVDHATAGLVRDRLIDNGIGFWYSGACLAVAMPLLALPARARDPLWLFVGGGAVLGLACIAIVLTRLPGRLGALVAKLTARSVRELAPMPGATLYPAIGWSLATRILQTSETALLLYCIGVPLTAAHVLVVDGALNAAGFVGFMLPQGLGVVEGTAVYMLGTIGVAPASATAFALARRGRVFLLGSVGVALHLRRSQS